MGHWGTAEQQLPWLVWKRHRVIQRMLWCSAWYRVGSSVSQKRNQKGQEAKCCCSKAGNDIVVAPIKPSMSSAATQRPTKVICEEQNPKAAVWQERERTKWSNQTSWFLEPSTYSENILEIKEVIGQYSINPSVVLTNVYMCLCVCRYMYERMPVWAQAQSDR